ncbi:MAG TPA: erythromycin esterase family protein [Candidatus Dormibacteraeota bacterium]
MDLPAAETAHWLTAEDLVREGFRRSRVVIMNEAHDGHRRCVRTRTVGRRVLPAAMESGARVLAMEALGPPGGAPPGMESPYLAQPEMALLMDSARQLGFTLAGYEAEIHRAPADLLRDTHAMPFTNWRERRQAENLLALLHQAPATDRVLVWCGNSHLRKTPHGEWWPMGYWLRELGGPEPFAIDQAVTVDYGEAANALSGVMLEKYGPVLESRGGEVGVVLDARLRADLGVDAVLLSTDNRME